MVELNRVDEVRRFRTYKIYAKHHLPHKGEHKLVATIHMNTGDNSLADCENLPVLFMNAQTYRDDAMRLRSEMEQKDREISRLQAGVEPALRERDQAVEALREIADGSETGRGCGEYGCPWPDLARQALAGAKP